MVVLIQLYSYMVQAGRRKEKSEESDPQLKQEGRNTSKAGEQESRSDPNKKSSGS